MLKRAVAAGGVTSPDCSMAGATLGLAVRPRLEWRDDERMPERRSNADALSVEDWQGLGLDYGTVGLAVARPEWRQLAERLANVIRDTLGASTASVEHIGSSAVPGLAAKPILDLAIGVAPHVPLEPLRHALEDLGYQFRGDAGDQGGLVFVLEDRPKRRVVHLHVVDHDGPQWRRYLTFRDLLLTNADARDRYERMKSDLAEKFPQDRKAYTAAKESLVRALLEQHAAKRRQP